MPMKWGHHLRGSGHESEHERVENHPNRRADRSRFLAADVAGERVMSGPAGGRGGKVSMYTGEPGRGRQPVQGPVQPAHTVGVTAPRTPMHDEFDEHMTKRFRSTGESW